MGNGLARTLYAALTARLLGLEGGVLRVAVGVHAAACWAHGRAAREG